MVFMFQGLGTDEETLIEIVCSRNNEELLEVKRVYKDSTFRSLLSIIFNKYQIKKRNYKLVAAGINYRTSEKHMVPYESF